MVSRVSPPSYGGVDARRGRQGVELLEMHDGEMKIRLPLSLNELCCSLPGACWWCSGLNWFYSCSLPIGYFSCFSGRSACMLDNGNI